MAAPEQQDRSVDSVEWAAVDDREKIVRFPTRSEPVLSLNDGFGGKPEPAGLRHRLPLRVDSGHPNLNGGINALSANWSSPYQSRDLSMDSGSLARDFEHLLRAVICFWGRALPAIYPGSPAAAPSVPMISLSIEFPTGAPAARRSNDQSLWSE